jgi:hypothetical protein
MLSSHHKKRSYSSVYKIYRRLRFIRYRKKTIDRVRDELRDKEIREQRETAINLRKFRQTERENLRLKAKAIRLEERQLKKELKEELKQRKIFARAERIKEEAIASSRKLQESEAEKIEKERIRKESLALKAEAKRIASAARSERTIKNRIKTFRENSSKRRRFILISVNSTVFFLVSYFVLFFISQLATVVAGSFFNYPATVYYYDVYFNISPEAWYHDSVKTIFSAGPVVNFVLGIIMIIIYNNIKESSISYKLFFLWGFIHSVNFLFGALLVGTLFETGVGHVISWMYVMDTGKLFYSILSIFLLVISGLLTTKLFLISANTYYNEINQDNRTSFIIGQVLLPYIAGNAALVLIRQPRFIFYDTFIALTLIISLLPVLVTYKSFNELYFEEEEKKPHLAWIAIAALLLLLFIFRVILEFGIQLG